MPWHPVIRARFPSRHLVYQTKFAEPIGNRLANFPSNHKLAIVANAKYSLTLPIGLRCEDPLEQTRTLSITNKLNLISTDPPGIFSHSAIVVMRFLNFFVQARKDCPP